ncbi:TPA: toprim domain-containing protein [Thermoplasmata archaeon]|nr:toprim domain-containing protein [Thermoplasmata archaeon]
MLTPSERLERILKVIEELDELSEEMPVIVEGRRDVEALRLLGINGEVVTLGKGVPLFAFCENISREWPSTVVLTDWDRKGGQLARRLKEAFEANGVKVNDSIRMALVILAKKEIKDIESLPSLVRRLQKAAKRS